MHLNKALTWFIKIWVAGVVLINAIAIVRLFVAANSFWGGLGRVKAIYNPFDVINYLIELVLLSPAIGAYIWLARRHQKDRGRQS